MNITTIIPTAIIPEDWCPKGYAIPDDPNNPHNWYINRTITECAVSCFDPPYLSDDEDHIRDLVRIWSLAVGCFCTVIVLSLWLLDWRKRGNVFEVTSGCVVTVVFMFLLICEAFNTNTTFCHNNTVPISGEYGFSSCALQGSAIIYLLLYFAIAFCLQSTELFRRIVLNGTKLVNTTYYKLLILIIPFISAFVGMITGMYGSRFGTKYCSLSPGNHPITVGFILVPLFIFNSLGVLFTLGIIAKLIILMREMGIRDSSKTWDGAAMTLTSLKFMFFSASYSVMFVAVRFAALPSEQRRRQIAVDFGACIFANYDGISDESYYQVCGKHPTRVMSFHVQCILMVGVTAAFGVFFAIVNIEGAVSTIKKMCVIYRAVREGVHPLHDPKYDELPVSNSSGNAITSSIIGQGPNYRLASRIFSNVSMAFNETIATTPGELGVSTTSSPVNNNFSNN